MSFYRNLWVDFATTGNSSARGFQISFLSVPDDLGYLIQAINDDDPVEPMNKIKQQILGYNQQVMQLPDFLILAKINSYLFLGTKTYVTSHLSSSAQS